MSDNPTAAAPSADGSAHKSDNVASPDHRDSPDALPSIDAESAADDETLSGSVTIIINPRWQREVVNFQRLGRRVVDTALAVLGGCAALDLTAREHDAQALAAWTRRLPAYEALVHQTEAAILDHPTWPEMPTAADTYGELMTLLRDALDLAKETALGNAQEPGAATAKATEAAGQATGLGTLLLAKIVDPMREEGDRMIRAWNKGLHLRVSAELPDESSLAEDGGGRSPIDDTSRGPGS